MFSRKSKKQQINLNDNEPIQVKSQDAIEEAKLIKEHCDSQKQRHTTSNTGVVSFFYVDDAFIKTFDDEDIFSSILNKYPNLNEKTSDASSIRSAILNFFSDTDFILQLMKYYDFEFTDLTKTVISKYLEYFRGSFIRKAKDTIKLSLQEVQLMQRMQRREHGTHDGISKDNT